VQSNIRSTSRPEIGITYRHAGTTGIYPIHIGGKARIQKPDPLLASLDFFQHLPRPSRPIVWAVKVVSLRDLHHAQTFRFPLDWSRGAGLCLGAPPSALTFAHPERALRRAAPAITRHVVE